MGLQWRLRPDCPELCPALDSPFLSSFGKRTSGNFYVLWLLWLLQQEGNLLHLTANLSGA